MGIMSAATEPELDPVIVELFAIRNFTKIAADSGPVLPASARQPLSEDQQRGREADWRALKPDAREILRGTAAEMLRQLLVDGISIRTTVKATAALHQAITNPATLAYELPTAAKVPTQ
jgi:hypothetical protein